MSRNRGPHFGSPSDGSGRSGSLAFREAAGNPRARLFVFTVDSESSAEETPESCVVYRLAEYRRFAAECRKIAQRMTVAELRRELDDMARTWETLANERERQLTGNSLESPFALGTAGDP
jgi:hypothetical protein